MNIFVNKGYEHSDLFKDVNSEYKIFISDEEISNQKSSLIIDKRKNSYIIPYDYGKGVVGKGEHVLRWGMGCIFNCEYCYSKNVNKSSNIYLFPDIEGVRTELKSLFKDNKKIHLNAGENYDSFILEGVIPFSTHLSYFVKEFPGLDIEFRSKACVPEFFIDNAEKDRIILAFSISPESIRKEIEIGVPSLEKRLDNIERLLEKGFKVALRFEPVILTPDFKEEYSELFREIANRIDIKRIESVDISLLRLTKPGFKNVSNIKILDAEWIFGKKDKKFRYFVNQRIRALRFLKNEMGKYYSGKIHIGTETEKVYSAV